MGKHGRPLTTARYMTAAHPGHPTAHADGRVRIHRAVLHDKIGPGDHACHWCKRPVSWGGSGIKRLVADHVDGDTWNNEPENLVPACRSCNSRRTRPDHLTHCAAGHPFTPENTYVRKDGGGRQCRTCNRHRDAKRRQKKENR